MLAVFVICIFENKSWRLIHFKFWGLWVEVVKVKRLIFDDEICWLFDVINWIMEVKIKKLINRKIAKWILENILIYRKKV